MKRTNGKDQRQIKLNRRLELVRTTVRVLTPTELEHVNGGTEESKQVEVGGTNSCSYWPFTSD